MEINKPLRIKSIWLDSKTASINTNRTQLIFNKLPLIQVRGSRNILKVNSISLASTNASNYTGHVWEFKIDRVLFNQNYYFNSDNNSIPNTNSFFIFNLLNFVSCSLLFLLGLSSFLILILHRNFL